ncbi:hypothetical protein GQX74_013156 [Glossina fuscipes]|nr:hypothetical protein GQX74_013156 [Glossina fuscipes]
MRTSDVRIDTSLNRHISLKTIRKINLCLFVFDAASMIKKYIVVTYVSVAAFKNFQTENIKYREGLI